MSEVPKILNVSKRKKRKLSAVLHFLSQKYLTLHPHIQNWTFAPSHDEGVLLQKIHLKNGEFILRYELFCTDQKYWKKTSNFAISIQSGSDPLFHEQLGRVFIQALQKLDDGSIEMDRTPPRSTNISSSSSSGSHVVDVERQSKILAEHHKRKDQLHWLAYIGLKTATTMDLYPHIKPLGEDIPTEKILEQWQQTLELMKQGKAPQKLGMYTHVPFCAVACTFCYCGKTDQFDKKLFTDYLDWLNREIDLFAPLFTKSTFTSWYFGGGTPSILPSGVLKDLFDMMHNYFYIEPDTQVIFEGNPDSLNDKKIEILKTHGKVTRLTIGLQTLDNRVQNIVRRYNKPHHVQNAVESARRWDIKHVNIDLMTGLPEQTLQSFQDDLEFVLSLDPDSVHINPYRPLPRVGLEKQNRHLSQEEFDLREKMDRWGKQRLYEAGHTSGLMGQSARKSKDASNIQEYDLRTQNSSLLGLGYGASSHSFAGSWYIPTMNGGFDRGLKQRVYDDWRWTGVPSSIEEEMHKFVIRNFHATIDRGVFVELFGIDCLDVFGEQFSILEELGAVEIKEEGIKYIGFENASIVYRGFLYSNAQLERIKNIWGADYDPDDDVYAKLRIYIEAFDFPW